MIRERRNFKKDLSCFLTILVLILVAPDCFAALEILNLRYWTAPDHTRIVLDTDSEPGYKIKERENLLVLSFRETSFHQAIKPVITLNKPGIKKIAFQQSENGDAKIEFFLDNYQKVEVFKLKKFQGKPDRIVVDIFLAEVPKELKTKEKTAAKKKMLIIIDPGHGGEDPGAVGKRGTYEKDIVLSISREIRKIINETPGYRAVLTRDGDYYVSFRKRLQKAKDLQAGIFISVHADAARNRNAKGSSVYCLSTGAASNEAAKLLAHNENLSDIFGGETDIESSNESNPIIMNMFQTNTINLSKIYAENLIKHLRAVKSLKYEIVQEAPFRVLKLPDIPAVLIETAYISNLQEERLLKKNNFQRTLALAISDSIKDYFAGGEKTPQGKDDEIATFEYKIKKGDSLFSVARYYNTKVDVLLELNDLKPEDTVFVGQNIMVPSGKEDYNNENISNQQTHPKKKNINQKKPLKLYTVKKGDTLFLVAKHNSTTIGDLLKINHMKITDPLLYGQRIKLPR